MRSAASLNTNAFVDPEALFANIVGAFPKLDSFQQRLSLEVYRLLALGQPVPRGLLADRIGSSIEGINQSSMTGQGCFTTPSSGLIGYWGLSIPSSYSSVHKLMVEAEDCPRGAHGTHSSSLSCSERKIVVESTSPTSGAAISLTVAPGGVKHVDPTDAQVSFLLPDAVGIQTNIVRTFCHFIHPSRQASEKWVAEHPGTFILSLAEADAVARLRNQAQYGEVLESVPRSD